MQYNLVRKIYNSSSYHVGNIFLFYLSYVYKEGEGGRMKITKSVSIKEVAKARDKLIHQLEQAKKQKLSESELEYASNDVQEFYDDTIDWVIEETQTAFDFDGEEDE